jgi:hypothetical protein
MKCGVKHPRHGRLRRQVVARGVAALEDALRFSADAGARHMCGILYSALAK